MLVNEKFYYISLPRCASTSFVVTCGKNKLNAKFVTDKAQKSYDSVDWTISDLNFYTYGLKHVHEPIDLLKTKFGTDYETIAVKRDKYERFVSLWKFILRNLKTSKNYKLFDKLSEFNENEILGDNTEFFGEDYEMMEIYVVNFMKRFGFDLDDDINKQNIKLLFIPTSEYHNFDPSIIWFDFNKLHEMEEWVSKKLNINFKLLNINDTSKIECNLKLTDNLKKRYDKFFDKFDIAKVEKTFL